MTTLRITPAPSNGVTTDGETAYVEEVAANVVALWARNACWLNSVTGTNAVTAVASPSLTTQAVQQQAFWLVPTVTNTGSATLNIDGQGALAVTDSTGVALAPGGLTVGNLYLLVMDGTKFRVMAGGTAGVVLASNAPDLVLQQQRTLGTGDGAYASANATVDRGINTTVRNVLPGATIATPLFTLPPGTYLIDWDTPGYGVSAFSSWLYNNTDSTRVATGSSETGVASQMTHSRGSWVGTITASKAFKIQFAASGTNATDGLGHAANITASGTEVFTTVRVWRVGTLGSQVAMALLNTITINSGDASEQDTTSFAMSGYSAFEIELENVVAGTDNITLQLQVQVSAAFPTTGYLGRAFGTSAGGSGGLTLTTGIPLNYPATLHNVAPGVSGSIRVSNPQANAKHPWWGLMSHVQTGDFAVAMVGGVYDTAGIITGIKISPTAGTLTSGKIRVFGIP